MLRPKRKAQSTAEYVIVLGLIVAAVVAMQTYVKRGFQSKIRTAVDYTGKEISDTDINGNPVTVKKLDGSQYEPYYLSSSFDSNRNSDEAEDLLIGGGFTRDIDTEHSDRSGSQTISGTSLETPATPETPVQSAPEEPEI